MSSDHSPLGLYFSEPPSDPPAATPKGRLQPIERVSFQEPPVPVDSVAETQPSVPRPQSADRLTFSNPERRS